MNKYNSNCGAFCIHCKKDNIYYSIKNGSYIYYCLNCQKWLNKYREVASNKNELKYLLSLTK